MRSGRLLTLIALVLLCLVLVAGCAGGRATPSTPPTFVMAWTADGQPGQVWTVESNDGIIWRNPSPQNLQGNLSESDAGPAVAHDGYLTWMLMWANPRGLDYKTGTGGITLSGRGGVTWEQQPLQGMLPVQVLGSPALAHGQNRWVVVFRTLGNRLRVVRSQRNDATAWEPARDIEIPSPGGCRPVVSPRDPALAFGNGTFVLIHRGQFGFFASTSPDGLNWTPRGPILPAPNTEMSDPAVTFSAGNFYAALRRTLPIPPAWAGCVQGICPPATTQIHKSPDGQHWTPVAESAGFFPPGRRAGPGLAFGDFGNNICKVIITDQAVQILPAAIAPDTGIQAWTGTPPPPHICMDAALLVFTPDEAEGEEVSSRTPRGRTAITFGRTVP